MALALGACGRGRGTAPTPPRPAPIPHRAGRGSALAARGKGSRWPRRVPLEGERVRVFGGLGMRARLVQVLGPVRALRVAQAVARFGGPVLGVDWGRRRLLRQSLALAGLALLRRIPGGTHAPRAAGSAPPLPGPGEGEIWEGFVLLPEGAPLPSFVTCAPAPILCQTDGSPEAEALRGEVLTSPDLEQLRPFIRFPLYRPSRLPPGIAWRGAAVTRFARSGEVFSVSLNFGDGEGVPRLRVIAQPRSRSSPRRSSSPPGRGCCCPAPGDT
jgi:hypothetical protein